jgi:hypothetical protein
MCCEQQQWQQQHHYMQADSGCVSIHPCNTECIHAVSSKPILQCLSVLLSNSVPSLYVQLQRHGAAVPLFVGLKRSPLLPRQRTPLLAAQRRCRTAAVRPQALFYPTGGVPNLNRVAAAPPQARQALLSSAISSCRDWRQLGSLVEAYGPYLSPNNISHCLTRLEQVLAAQQLTAGEAEQVRACT